MSIQEEATSDDSSHHSEDVFSEHGILAELYPAIEEIQVTIKHNGKSDLAQANTREYYVRYGKNVVDYVECTNPMCRNGGFSIGNLINKMVDSCQTYLQKDYIPCPGYVGSGPGVAGSHRCTNFFGIRIDIRYKAESPGEDAESV